MTSTIAAGTVLRDRVRPKRTPTLTGARRVVRLLLAAVMAAAGVIAILNEHAFRVLEVELASRLLPLTFATNALPSFVGDNPAVAFETGGHWVALVVTIECSIALYLGPLLLLAAAFYAMPRMGLVRVTIATVISFTAMALLNQVRILMLGYALTQYGHDAFEWAHSLVGSSMMLIGIAACLMLFFRVVIIGSRHTPKTRARTVRAANMGTQDMTGEVR